MGSGHHSAITVFSFHPVKIITTGEGGAALSRDPELVERLQRLRSHGISRDAFEQISPGPWYYEQQELGFNYRLTDLQASLGLSQLQRLSEIVDRRQELMACYRQLVQGWPLRFLEEPANCRSSYHLAVVTIPEATLPQHRACLRACGLRRLACNCTTGRFRLQPHYRRLGFQPGDFPWLSAMPTPASACRCSLG